MMHEPARDGGYPITTTAVYGASHPDRRATFIREKRLSRHLLDMTQCIVGVLVAPSQLAGEPD
jgi:hypothetical protein